MLEKIPSKVLLFGEYTILYGSSALAIPNKQFYGHWVKEGGPLLNRQALENILQFLKAENVHFLKIDDFEHDLKSGLNFVANIPIGYGVGSSGAVSAAILKRYARNESADLSELRERLQGIENHFHGNSSGLDPLVSYLNKSILLKQTGAIQLMDSSSSNFNKLKLFLLDTKLARSTAPLVKIFKEKMKEKHFSINVHNVLLDHVEMAIQHYLNGQEDHLMKQVHEISNFQHRHFSEMILENHQSIWRQALASPYFKLKLCGAGGGGFILGFSLGQKETEQALEDKKQDIIWL